MRHHLRYELIDTENFCNSAKGTSINDVLRFLAFFDLPTMSDDFYHTNGQEKRLEF